MDDPVIEYATTPSGRRIAYAWRGAGQEVVLPPPTTWTLLPPRPVPAGSDLRQLAEHARLLAYDHAGTGLSTRAKFDFSLDACVEELAAVVDAAGADEFVLFANMYAGPIAIRYAVEHPDRVMHLILRSTWPSSRESAHARLQLLETALVQGNWVAASQAIARLGWDASGAEADAVAENLRAATDAETLLAFFRGVSGHDVRDLLSDVTVPTTVLRRNTPNVPLTAEALPGTEELVQSIPGAQLRFFTAEHRWDWPVYAEFAEARTEGGEAVRPRAGADAAGAVVAAGLSARELDVLRLLPAGSSNRAIADQLVIAESTVANHVRNILAKTGTANRTEAGAWAVRHGLGED